MKKERVMPLVIDPAMEREPYSLRDTTLRVYADLWEYSRENPFNGSYNRLADWLGVPKTTVIRSINELQKRGLVEVITINAHKTTFQAKAIPGYPLRVWAFKIKGQTDQNEPIIVQYGPKSDQNGPYHNNIYNNNTNNNNYQKRNYNKINPIPSGPTADAPFRKTNEEVREMEEKAREEAHRLRDLHDIEANTPEALAARDRFFEKWDKLNGQKMEDTG